LVPADSGTATIHLWPVWIVIVHDYDRRQWGRTARAKLSPWGGEDHEWPAVDESRWDEERVQGNRFGDVFVMRYVAYGLPGTPKVTVDSTPWSHKKRPEFEYQIEIFDEKVKRGKMPLDSYERGIANALDDALKHAAREAAQRVKELEQLKVSDWELTYDKRGDDLVVEYKAPGLSEYSDSSMSGSFYSPLDIFSGGKADYDISYSKGADYQGHFGSRSLRGQVRSIADIKKVLQDAVKLWQKAEAPRVAIHHSVDKTQIVKRIKEIARAEGYHRGARLTYKDIAKHCDPRWPPRLIAEAAELAGFPVWTSAPHEAMKPF